MPYYSAQNPESDKQLFWQQMDNQRRDQISRFREQDRNEPLANNLDYQVFQNRLNQTNQAGLTATAGVLGSVRTQKERQAQYRAQQEAKRQQETMRSMQDQMNSFMKTQQTNAANQLNQWQTEFGQWQQNAAGMMQGQGGQNRTGQYAYSGQDSQFADYMRQAGFPEEAIPMGLAIIQAESGGNPKAVNNSNSNGSSDYGLFQINTVHSELLKSNPWDDPAANARMAYQVWKDAGGKWTPWSTYSNGAYQQFLKAAPARHNGPANMQPFTVSTTNGLRTALVGKAQSYSGLPYVWGGTDLSKGVDCSGLVQSVYNMLGIKLPRTAHEQSRSSIGTRTSISNLKPGDLVAWQGGWRGPDYVGHIAVYAGNGEIIEAPSAGQTVRRRKLRNDENTFGVHLSLPGD